MDSLVLGPSFGPFSKQTTTSPDNPNSLNDAVSVEAHTGPTIQIHGLDDTEGPASGSIKDLMEASPMRGSIPTLHRMQSFASRGRAAPQREAFDMAASQNLLNHKRDWKNFREWTWDEWSYSLRNVMDLFPYDVESMVVRTHVRRGHILTVGLSLLVMLLMLASCVSALQDFQRSAREDEY